MKTNFSQAPLILPSLFTIMLSLVLVSCGQYSSKTELDPHNSTGQVGVKATSTVSYYAAARFADQVSFGATPELIAEIQSKGFEGWITAQMALPVKESDMGQLLNFVKPDPLKEALNGKFLTDEFWKRAFTASDQLRQRLTWAIFQYIPTAQGTANGNLQYYNLLQRKAFTNYAELLHDVTIHPMMGFYLNNEQNRPSSSECLGCTPNENYARELMQLFSVGVIQLNIDGSTIRDGQGKAKETYTQKDVEELARALTGWRAPDNNTSLPDHQWPHYNQLMVPEGQAFLHDRGAKTVMSTPIGAGMAAPQELDAVIALLMKHPNVAPFVSLRLIQHLVTSDPSPQYLSRVATVFKNNGQGGVGDLKAVVRAILLDTEARRGDQLGTDSSHFGMFREPVLWHAALMRGLSCKSQTYDTNVEGIPYVDGPPTQYPTSPPSVFSFYQATGRAPGSNLLAPEQKLINTAELTNRLGNLNWRFADKNNKSQMRNITESGCDLTTLSKAFSTSSTYYIDHISNRWFRGAMPATLRSSLLILMQGEHWDSPEQGALTILQFALSSPYFGVIK